MLYELKALREREGVVSLRFDAADENAAAKQATIQGYTVLTVKPRSAWNAWASRGGRHRGFSLLLFSRELLVLLKSGLPLAEALQTLAEKERETDARQIIDSVVSRLREGQPLSSAMQQFPAAFPALYVATIRASEKTGDLPEALDRFVIYQSQLDVVRKKVLSALIYPAVLMLVGGLVSLFLMLYVVPRFSQIYEDIGGNLPFFSRLLLSWGSLLQAHTGAVLAAAGGVIAAVAYVLLNPGTRQWLGETLWRVPGIGERLRLYHLARFYRTVGMLLRDGIPVVNALSMVAGVLPPAMRQALVAAARGISEGLPTSRAMDANGLTTPVALRMLVVGERASKMGEMMENIASFHDEEIARWVDWFIRLFEPLLMAFIGIVIGVIVVLMYLPIFELAASVH
jgi:general secretion pathway protein F